MRNILMTVMLLIVVVVIFTNVITNDTTGTKKMIEEKGTSINSQIGSLIRP
ncbi:hypothetical protein [Paenibacillus sp. J2TS4]|uniref:hypothetical protein n=1 Tax=Paenibacillus sp. J2TS4 TaxID=2807194 RepID=UPI001BCCC055|nr:hypothetical protein [Paenibacillus sp. J2TS4]